MKKHTIKWVILLVVLMSSCEQSTYYEFKTINNTSQNLVIRSYYANTFDKFDETKIDAKGNVFEDGKDIGAVGPPPSYVMNADSTYLEFSDGKKLIFITDSVITKDGKEYNSYNFLRDWKLVKQKKDKYYYELTIDNSYLEKAF